MDVSKGEIGGRIKYAREQRGLEQKDLAGRIATTNKVISSYESGRAYPPVPVLARLAEALNVAVGWLITGLDPGPAPKPPTPEERLRQVITGDPALLAKVKEDLRAEVREELTTYGRRPDDPDERKLVEAWHSAEDVIKEEALGMLVRSAERLKGRGGGEKNSPFAKSG